MKPKLPKPNKKAIIYEDKKLYACLANYPVNRGHTVVVWKDDVSDLHFLSRRNYEYLMDRVDETRDALLKTLKIKKVYLIYMDEIKHVHWHLVPRYRETGYNVFLDKPKRIKDFSLAERIKKNLQVRV